MSRQQSRAWKCCQNEVNTVDWQDSGVQPHRGSKGRLSEHRGKAQDMQGGKWQNDHHNHKALNGMQGPFTI